jgi:hypothetical protein
MSAMVEANELREPPHTALRYRRTNLESAKSRSKGVQAINTKFAKPYLRSGEEPDVSFCHLRR